MRKSHREAYRRELSRAREAEAVADFSQAFSRLERAHILSQRFALAHAATHLRMLRLGYRIGDGREVRGQLMRAVSALLFSRIWVPPGNTGRASVSAFASMPVPQDLAAVLTEA